MTLPGLYIHVPFCKIKCPYCDFYSCTDAGPGSRFSAALERELCGYRDGFPEIDTLYLGGGTPTALADAALAEIIGAVRRQVAVKPGAETTIEANPNDLSRRRLEFFRGLGFNRLSLGVQSFDDEELKFLGRRHTAAEARQAFGHAREAGFDNISIDLMYAIPGQSLDGWKKTLAEAVYFHPEHLSCYQLTIKEGTPFFDRVCHQAMEPCPEQVEAEFFMFTSAFLEDRGYRQYEVSSFSLADHLQARHNRKYWEHAPYLGLGPSAHSFDGRRRWWNVKSVDGYIEKLRQGVPPLDAEETLTDDQLRTEELMLALRTRRGVALEKALAFGQARAALERLEAEGLLKIADGRVVTTVRGLLYADRMALELVRG